VSTEHAPKRLIPLALICAAVFLALGAAPATARQIRLFGGSFGSATSTTVDPYPVGRGGGRIAVDTSSGPSNGDVYFTDERNNRVEKFDPAGNFLLMFGAGVLAAGAEGTGDLTAGSKQITSVKTSKRTFMVSEQIEGAGIPPETSIATVGVGTITLTKAATASGTGVALSVAEAPTNVADNEQQKVTLEGTPTGGSFTLTYTDGTLEGTAGESEVTATSEATGSLHVGDVTTVGSGHGRGELTAGSTTVSNFEPSSGTFAVGQPIVAGFRNGGLPLGTTIAAVGANSLTLSKPAIVSGSAGSFGELTALTEVAAIDTSTGSFTLSAKTNNPGKHFITATETSAPIPHNASAAEVEEALEALTGIGAGNVAVSGSAGGPFTVEFKGPLLADADVPQLEVAASGLQPSSATATVTTPVQGHSIVESCAADCQPGTAAPGQGAFEHPSREVANEGGVLSRDHESLSIAVDGSHGPSAGDVYVGEWGGGRNQVQLVRITNSTNGGTFTLSFEGQTTGPISSVATGAEVSKALGKLSTVGPGNVEVFEVKPGDRLFYVEFIRGLSTTEQPLLSANGAGLAAGAGISVEAFLSRVPGALPNVVKFDESGNLVSGWASGGRLVGDVLADGPFHGLGGVAVDQVGNLWFQIPSFRESAVQTEPALRMFEFGQDATPITDWEPSTHVLESGLGFAVDAEDDIYLPSSRLLEFDPTGTEIGLVARSAEIPAADPKSGDLFLTVKAGPEGADLEPPSIERFDKSCHPVPTLGAGGGCTPVESFPLTPHLTVASGLAVDYSTPAKTIFVADKFAPEVDLFATRTVPDVLTGKPTGAGPTAATLNGTVNPSGVALSKCFFQWGEAGKPYEHETACEHPNAGEVGAVGKAVAVHAAIILQAGHSYHYRLVAGNANDVNSAIDEPSTGADLRAGPPLVDATFAVGVSAESANLAAEIDPQDVATGYRFEFLTEAEYLQNGETFSGARQVPLQPASLGSAGEDVKASQLVQGLAPGTAYRFRAIAESPMGQGAQASVGPARSFTTQRPGAFALLDNRGWELVSPPDKHGALIGEPGHLLVQAASSGGAVTYRATSPTEAAPSGYTSDGVQVLSARGPGGWFTRDLTVPHSKSVGAGNPTEVPFLSSDLSRSILAPLGAFLPLSPLATEQTPYVRSDFAPSGPPAFCESECDRPIVTAAEGVADVPPGTEFGPYTEAGGGKCPVRESSGFAQEDCGPKFRDATPDLLHVFLTSKVPLVSGAPGSQLYEFSAAAPPAESLRLVSVLPNGTPIPPTSGGSATVSRLGSQGGAIQRHAISADGSRVAFTYNDHLYLRINATAAPSPVSGAALDGSQCTEPEAACTIQLDTVQGGSGSPGSPLFQLASADATRIFFTDESQLTADSGAEFQKHDLYEYDLRRPLGQRLADLTPKRGGESAAVQATLPGASEDAEYLYFVANGVLAHNAVDNGAGPEVATPGDCGEGAALKAAQSCNLYLLHAGAITFIASLAGADGASWAAISDNLEGLSAGVSPNGRWLAFMSRRSLTGYDNSDAASGEPDQEAFLYHAPAGEGEEGRLVCASCDPSGARPHGVETDSGISVPSLTLLGRTTGNWPVNAWLAGILPVVDNQTSSLYQPRYLSDQGRLFFDSTDALVPRDSNGAVDVYEYEPAAGEEAPPGDSCAEVSPTFSAAQHGCIDLVSSGASPGESGFLDASESGSDVFFLTQARLSQKDFDTTYDVYDARVGGGEAEPVKPPPCEGDACQSPVAAPEDPTPGSLAFQGPGNLLAPVPASVQGKAKPLTRAQKLARALKACATRPKRERPACRGRARRAYGPAGKAKKSKRRGK
jgi:hypothetical protein